MAPPSKRSTPPPEAVLEINGWKIYAHPLFIEQIQTLIDEVDVLRSENPDTYQDKKKTKLLAAILKMAFEVIPQDPSNRTFFLGNTLGGTYRHWHRGKFFEGRYRLFFRYSSSEKIIVLAWVNDSETLRTYGSKDDAYAVFKKMLGKGNPPDSWDQLLKEAQKTAKSVEALVKISRQRK